ncbi:MAG: short-chain dehydrogenase [Gemmatimonadales bacterium]|nr:3-oxoacyl-[acyl-carrier-protein] reductase FabG [bacterium HR33]GIW51858.1 MAG: short-chain dehydrogenase [Gemmatimonadales bacterium]
MDLGIAGKAALVCGSSSGLGRAIADKLAEEGCRVAINGRDEERLNHALCLLRERHSVEIEAFRADVSVPEEAESLVHEVNRRFGTLDILICNAGGPPAGPFAELEKDAWQRALELNLLSTVHLCRTAVPIMRERRWGRIVCLTSIAAKQPIPGLILSTTARAGVLGFAKALADEVAQYGITVNCVCPGYMETDRLTDVIEHRAAASRRSAQEVAADLLAGVPVGRIGRPEELAAAVAFLASKPAAYITGVALAVDGGYLRAVG